MDISSGDVHMNLWSDVDQIKIDLVQESTGGEEVGTNDVDNSFKEFSSKRIRIWCGSWMESRTICAQTDAQKNCILLM